MSEQDALRPADASYGAADHTHTDEELDRLLESAAASVTSLTAGVRQLERLAAAAGAWEGATRRREQLFQKQQSVLAQVTQTAAEVRRLTAAASGRRGARGGRLRAERVAAAFRDALAVYAPLQTRVRDVLAAPAPPAPRASAYEDTQADEAALLANQQAQVREAEWETVAAAERAEQVAQLEADVRDVNQMMCSLAELVSAQGGAVSAVEGGVEDAGAAVEAGADHLVKAAGLQSRYRRKLLALLLAALLAALVLTVVLVRSLR